MRRCDDGLAGVLLGLVQTGLGDVALQLGDLERRARILLLAVGDEALGAQGVGALQVTGGFLEVELLELDVLPGFGLVSPDQRRVQFDERGAFLDELAVLDVDLADLAADLGLDVAEKHGADEAGRIDALLDVAEGDHGLQRVGRGRGRGTGAAPLPGRPGVPAACQQDDDQRDDEGFLGLHLDSVKAGRGSARSRPRPTCCSAASILRPCRERIVPSSRPTRAKATRASSKDCSQLTCAASKAA